MVDDGEVDSPVLGMWADVEEKRVRGGKTGEWTSDVGNDGPQGRNGGRESGLDLNRSWGRAAAGS